MKSYGRQGERRRGEESEQEYLEQPKYLCGRGWTQNYREMRSFINKPPVEALRTYRKEPEWVTLGSPISTADDFFQSLT